MARAMTAQDKRDEFEHTKTMLKGAAYMFNKRLTIKQEVEVSRAPSVIGSDEGYQSGETPKHIKFAPCPEGHSCEKCKKSVETSESLDATESPDTTETPKAVHEQFR
jgi:predicted sulfurtransferase